MANLANLEIQQINSDSWHPFKKFLRMASFANLENQQINGVLGIWYNGIFGQYRKSTDQQRFLVPIQKILSMASLANLENQQNQFSSDLQGDNISIASR